MKSKHLGFAIIMLFCESGPPYNLEDAPLGIFITPGQTLEIYSEDDVVVIKGDMSTEQIVVS